VPCWIGRQCNRGERVIGKAKEFRRFATRDEKPSEMYLAVVLLDFDFITCPKARENRQHGG
jgi:hypothetical protein